MIKADKSFRLRGTFARGIPLKLFGLGDPADETNSVGCFGSSCSKCSPFGCCMTTTTTTTRSNEATSDRHRSTILGSYSKLFRKQHRSESFSQSSLANDDIPQSDQHQLGRREITAEARVTRSLAVVIGCFVCCWLPFFTLYIIRAVCLCLSFDAIEFFVWLGYSNSSINPVLYAILNKNFRLAFKNIFLSIKKFVCL